MRVRVQLDDKLLVRARRLTGVQSEAELVRRGLELLIQRESARRLAMLGGSEPELRLNPCRRRSSETK